LNNIAERLTVIAPSVFISLINVITCVIFERIAAFERSHTTNDETRRQFQKILIMQFINIAIVILLVNINAFDNGLFGLPILAGEYDDLDAKWYS
jgi:hypothetical protein